MVVDGSTNDDTLHFIKDSYANDKRVELRQNKTDDFMHTCFESVNLVKTEFVTFMYDDDVISPYFKDMVHYMLNNNKSFIMGYGIPYKFEEIYPFKQIHGWQEHHNLHLLLGYFSCFDGLSFTALPFSPICCVVTTDTLRTWISYVTNFTRGNKIKEYFMMQRNIGPDLMIYLSAILQKSGNIIVVPAIVAQFSVHASSMSITYGKLDLDIGYWLAKIWAFQQVSKAGYLQETAACGAYLLTYGGFLILRKIRRKDLSWVREIGLEMLNISFKLLNERLVISTFKAFCQLLFNRVALSKDALPE
jgi:hypothetical protein